MSSRSGTPEAHAESDGVPPDEPDDVITQATDAPKADEIFDKYLTAIGGAARIAWGVGDSLLRYGNRVVGPVDALYELAGQAHRHAVRL